MTNRIKYICDTIDSFPEGEYLVGEFPENGDWDNYLTTDQCKALVAENTSLERQVEVMRAALEQALVAIDGADNGHCSVMPNGKTTVCYEYRKFNNGKLNDCPDEECLSNVIKSALHGGKDANN